MKTSRLILYAFRDLFARFLPKSASKRLIKPADFTFLVHPRNFQDVVSKYPFTKSFPAWLTRAFVKHLWPVIVSPITGLKNKNNQELFGYVIACPMLADQMMKNRKLALKRITQAAKLAEKTGAKILGLGALTASLTKGGLDLVNKVNINLTSGYAYTSVIVNQHTLKAAKALNIDISKALVAVVGAAGNIGSNSARLLVKKGVKNFLLVDLLRKKDKVEALAKELKAINSGISLQYSNQVHSISQADIVIAATNAPETIIRPSDLKPGTVVIDDAQPSDISEDVFKKRNDVLLLEGGVVKTPGIQSHFNFGLANRDDNFGCLGEVLILSWMGWEKHYALGKLEQRLIEEIQKAAEKLNFSPGDFQNAYQSYTEKDIERIKQIRQSKI